MEKDQTNKSISIFITCPFSENFEQFKLVLFFSPHHGAPEIFYPTAGEAHRCFVETSSQRWGLPKLVASECQYTLQLARGNSYQTKNLKAQLLKVLFHKAVLKLLAMHGIGGGGRWAICQPVKAQ